ncbi:MAG: type II secretion system minor pseudopilin GspH [Vibrio sp.]
MKYQSTASGSHSNQQGFTLLEVLLVVVVMAMTAMAVVQTLPTSKANQAKEESARFFQRLQLLSDDAVLNGLDYGVRFDEQKATYVYMQLTEDGWEEVAESKYFTSTEMPEDLKYVFELGGDEWNDDDRLFKEEDFFEDETKKPKPPQVFVLSSGEVTPFTLSFVTNTSDNSDQSWRVAVNEAGVIHLLEPGEKLDDLNEKDDTKW